MSVREQAIAAAMLLSELRVQGDLQEEDAQLVVESETNLVEAARHVLAEIDEAAAHVAALDIRMTALKARQDRLKARGARLRDVLLAALDLAELPSLRLPEATLSRSNGRAAVTITDEAAIPDDWWRVETVRKLERSKLTDAVKAGMAIPGCSLGNGGPSLSIRRT